MVKVRLMEEKDLKAVFSLIQDVTLPEEVFVKDSLYQIQYGIGKSIVAYNGKNLVGVLILDGNLIDTIVSSKSGTATVLLGSLAGSGYHFAYVSPLNKKSRQMFEKNGFTSAEITKQYGYDRLVYEGIL